MTPLRKYGTSLLDQEIGIGAQRERDARAVEGRAEGQNLKADASDFRRARRAYRRAMRNEDAGMASMALRGMEAFGSAAVHGSGIQNAGWSQSSGAARTAFKEYKTGRGPAGGQSFAERADGGVWVDVSGNKRPLEDEERRPSYSDSLESRRGAAQDMIREYRSAKQAGGKVDKGSFLRRAQEIGLGSGLGPGFADRIEKLFDSAVARQERADMESSAAKRRAAEDARAASGAMTGRERGRWAVDRMGFQGAAEDYFRDRSPLKNLDRDISRLDRWERALESGQNQLDAVTGKYITRLGLSRGKTPLFSQR